MSGGQSPDNGTRRGLFATLNCQLDRWHPTERAKQREGWRWHDIGPHREVDGVTGSAIAVLQPCDKLPRFGGRLAGEYALPLDQSHVHSLVDLEGMGTAMSTILKRRHRRGCVVNPGFAPQSINIGVGGSGSHLELTILEQTRRTKTRPPVFLKSLHLDLALTQDTGRKVKGVNRKGVPMGQCFP